MGTNEDRCKKSKDHNERTIVGYGGVKEVGSEERPKTDGGGEREKVTGMGDLDWKVALVLYHVFLVLNLLLTLMEGDCNILLESK